MTTSFDPAALGFDETRPGSGVWRKSGRGNTFEPRSCARCDSPFMGRRASPEGEGLYCSKSCASSSQSNGPRTADPVYSTRHSRVLAARGRAAEQECTDCGGRAREWSQRHGTDGTEPSHYDPRCNRCHQVYDGAGAKPGELHPSAKLTEAQVRDIFTSTGRSGRELSEIHSVSQQLICDIRKGRRWRHVTAQLEAGYNSDRSAGTYALDDLTVTAVALQAAS